jgi:hypothetical protein
MAEKLDIVSQLSLRGQIGGFTLCRNDHPEALAISRFGEHHGYVRPYS